MRTTAKDLFFPHDFHAGDQLADIQIEHGTAGVGVYWLLVEWLHQNNGKLAKERIKAAYFALRFTEDDKRIAADILENKTFFAEDEEGFSCRRICNNLQKIEKTKEKLREAGKKGAEARWQERTEEKPMEEKKSEQPKQQPEPAQAPTPAPQKQPQAPKPARGGKVTMDELKAYADDVNLQYVNLDRFMKYYGDKVWKEPNEWKQALIKWNYEDKNKNRYNAQKVPDPEAKENEGSFVTSEFFKEALKKSYGQNYERFFGEDDEEAAL